MRNAIQGNDLKPWVISWDREYPRDRLWDFFFGGGGGGGGGGGEGVGEAAQFSEAPTPSKACFMHVPKTNASALEIII